MDLWISFESCKCELICLHGPLCYLNPSFGFIMRLEIFILEIFIHWHVHRWRGSTTLLVLSEICCALTTLWLRVWWHSEVYSWIRWIANVSEAPTMCLSGHSDRPMLVLHEAYICIWCYETILSTHMMAVAQVDVLLWKEFELHCRPAHWPVIPQVTCELIGTQNHSCWF